jgi:hypothetical protein
MVGGTHPTAAALRVAPAGIGGRRTLVLFSP